MDIDHFAFFKMGLETFWAVAKAEPLLTIAIVVMAAAIELIPFIKRNKSSSKKKNGKARSRNKKKVSAKTSSSKRTRKHNHLRSDDTIINSKLEDLSWREFEKLCFLYFKSKGMNPRETSEGADGGVDLIIYDKDAGGNVAVQIKHYMGSGNKIEVEKIRELHAARQNYNCLFTMFISTSRFTQPALQQADIYKMDTKDIDWVNNNIVKWQRNKQK